MKLALLLCLGLAAPRTAWAHTVGVRLEPGVDLSSVWTWQPGVMFGIGVFSAGYWLGFCELREAGVVGRGLKRWQVGAFAAGILALLIALVSPVHALGQVLFCAHMTQHEILMLVAAPLIVLGRPLAVLLKAMPRRLRRPLLRAGSLRWVRSVGRFFGNGLVAWLVHGAVLWLWHLPFLFAATLQSDLVHAAQHLSFFGTALLFWWAVLDGHHKRLGFGVAVVYLFTTAMHSGILGALLTFSQTVWYQPYSHSTQSWGLTPLEDQQLGGLIMWIPASVAYIVPALALFAGWLRASDERASARLEWGMA